MSIKERKEEYLRQRATALERYPVDDPVLCLLRRLKTTDVSFYEQLLFYLGEIDDIDRGYRHTVWWCTDMKNIDALRQAFHLLCPHGDFVVRDDGADPVSFRVSWMNDTDMHPIVFNKILFPDFSIVPKHTLDF